MTKSGEKRLTGILMLNLGGPDSLSAVRPFLYNLFSDREIIRLGPAFMQKPIAWLISVLRSGKTRRMYESIGGKSPILEITGMQARHLEEELNRDGSVTCRVYIGMRYWRPFVEDTLEKIIEDDVERLIVLSLYPHYSRATTGSSLSAFEAARKKLRGKGRLKDIDCIDRWYDFPPYIDALASSISKGISESGFDEFDIIYSAHSLPRAFIEEGDPYLDHIKETIELTNRRLSAPPYLIKNPNWHLSFQSKTGPVQWLEPSTEETIIRLSRSGVRNILAVPVSFVSDHIETLYEIDIMYREIARDHGINLYRCPSLNASSEFIDALKKLVIERL